MLEKFKYFISVQQYFIFHFVTYELINNFIVLWLGKEFILPRLTVFLIIINLFVTKFVIFKDGNRGFFDDIQLPISEAVINFVLSNGVIIGTIASNILIICIARPIIVFKRCFNKNIKDYIKIYGNYLILIIISNVLL